MINSPEIQHNARSALAARDILSLQHRGVLSALILMLLVGVGVLAGGPSVLAQESIAAAAPATPAKKAAAPAPAATQVNINTADAKTLAAGLKGVGESRAAEIIRYREAYGPFASADELMEVKGIGQSTLDMNRNVITLE